MFTSRPRANRLRFLPALLAGMMLLALPASAFGDTGDPLRYYGGPVVHSTTGVLVDWGSRISSVFTNPTTGDPAFISYLSSGSGSTSDLSGVLAQYMDSSGHNAANRVSYGGQYAITPSVTSTTVEDSQIQQELVAQIGAGQLPRPSGDGLSSIYLVLFPPGDTICMPSGTGQACSGSVFCAYHGSTKLADGTHVLYAVLPDNTTGSMTWGCGSAPSALQNQTSYLSHEWSETITDPLVAESYGDSAPLAWYDDHCNSTRSCNNGEIGDKCNQQQASNGPWTVQAEWSNRDSACVASEPAYAQPTASFNDPAAVDPGQTASFDASASSDPAQNTAAALDASSTLARSYSIASALVAYDWNWGDGTPDAGGVSATHVYPSAGTYQVSLTVTDALGFTSTVTRAVTVGSPPPAPAPPPSGTTSTGVSTTTSAGTPGTVVTTAPSTTGSAAPATTTSTPSSTTQGGNVTPAKRPGTAVGTVARAGRTPLVRLGAAPQVSGRQVAIRGWVKPGPGMTRVHVEFGTTAALGHSSAVLRLAHRARWRAVRLTLVGLRPHTAYRVRLVATGPHGTVVTREITVLTGGGSGRAPRFALRTAAAGGTVAAAAAARRSVLVAFRCSSSCTVHLSLLPRLSPRLRAIAVPLVVSRASAKLRRGGRGVMRLNLPRPMTPAALSGLVVSGYAAAPSGASSPSVGVPAAA